MIYKPRSHTHDRRHRLNWSGTVEIVIGMLAWIFVCAISVWAINEMLKIYTK
jgi:hypothetical protein